MNANAERETAQFRALLHLAVASITCCYVARMASIASPFARHHNYSISIKTHSSQSSYFVHRSNRSDRVSVILYGFQLLHLKHYRCSISCSCQHLIRTNDEHRPGSAYIQNNDKYYQRQIENK